ncbi:hypothetical protein CMI37_37110 [Candidatus Pacearchaeota archaeon]|nr:hypothetical protein [Candidatus Pacearchaeota archaeon]|tara:strand:+ start:668 stop:886 length:219 start_codon:yes stop_codon:yes gene_type:complete
MNLPVSFNQFKKNPIAAVAFLLVLVVGYLYMDLSRSWEQRHADMKVELSTLKNDYEDLQDKYLELIEKLKDE